MKTKQYTADRCRPWALAARSAHHSAITCSMAASCGAAPRPAAWGQGTILLAFMSALAMAAATLPVYSAPPAKAPFINEILIVGERTAANQLTGSAYHIGSDELGKYAYGDIQQILREVPGVSLQTEDGYGLRPNISIRGVASERSGRITLLEDNVLIAPAPYSAPSAYYFPTAGRMAGIEVVKGPAAVTQGPYTIGGALNMVSTPVPTDPGAGKVLLETGQDGTQRLHAAYGGSFPNGFNFLLETHQWRADGFQDIDRSSGDSGLELDDYMLKLGYSSPDQAHHFELKLQYADQDSEQSYLGLSDEDIKDDANRRYGLSALDNISTSHEQQILRYQFAADDSLSFSATLYNNEHERDWYKTEGLDLDGSESAETLSRTSWFNVIQAVNSGAGLPTASASALQAILDGTADTAPGSIQLRSNARQYYSRGLQLRLVADFNSGAARHELEVGLRYHEDEEDRLQRNSSFHQQDGALRLDDLGLLGNAGNRVQRAKAWSAYIYDRIEIGDWVIAPGLRYEDISQKRIRWETRAGRTSDPSSRAAHNYRDSRANDTTVLLPGLGAVYTISDGHALVGGVHKGFTAPSNAPDVDEEESLNYELGYRFFSEDSRAEVMLFLSDYDNLLGECTSSSGNDCEAGDAFNGDAATVKGLELSMVTNLRSGSGLMFPLSFSYTYLHGEFDSDIADTDFFGDVSRGDPLPYLPEHRINADLGMESGDWGAYLNLHYVDEVCVRASCGAFERTDSAWLADLSVRYQLSEVMNLYGRLENLSDNDAILGRHPYGARPARGRSFALGLSAEF